MKITGSLNVIRICYSLFAGGLIRSAMAPLGSTIFSMLYVYSILQVGIIYANMTETESND